MASYEEIKARLEGKRDAAKKNEIVARLNKRIEEKAKREEEKAKAKALPIVAHDVLGGGALDRTKSWNKHHISTHSDEVGLYPMANAASEVVGDKVAEDTERLNKINEQRLGADLDKLGQDLKTMSTDLEVARKRDDDEIFKRYGVENFEALERAYSQKEFEYNKTKEAQFIANDLPVMLDYPLSDKISELDSLEALLENQKAYKNYESSNDGLSPLQNVAEMLTFGLMPTIEVEKADNDVEAYWHTVLGWRDHLNGDSGEGISSAFNVGAANRASVSTESYISRLSKLFDKYGIPIPLDESGKPSKNLADWTGAQGNVFKYTTKYVNDKNGYKIVTDENVKNTYNDYLDEVSGALSFRAVYDAVNAPDFNSVVNATSSLENLNELMEKAGIDTSEFYDRFSDDEREIIMYHLGKGNNSIAKWYSRQISEIREYQRIAKHAENFDKWGEAAEVGMQGVSGLVSSGRGMTQGLLNWLTANPDAYEPFEWQQGVSKAAENNSDIARTLGAVAESAGQQVLPITASAAAGVVSKNLKVASAVYSAAFGASTAGNTYNEAIARGMTTSEAWWYSTLVATSEVTLDKIIGGVSKHSGSWFKKTGAFGSGGAALVVDKIKDVASVVARKNGGLSNAAADTIGRLATGAYEVGSDAFHEAIEESLQALIEPAIEYAVTGDFEGVSAEEALYNGFVGALTAIVTRGASSGYSSLRDAVGNTGRYKRLGKSVIALDGGVDKIKALGSTFDADKVSYKIADKVNGKTGAYKIGKLLSAIKAELSEQNRADIANGLVKRGVEPSNAEAIADSLAGVVLGQELTSDQAAALEGFEALSDVVKEVLFGKESSVSNRTKDYYRLMSEIKAKTEYAAAKTNTGLLEMIKRVVGGTFKANEKVSLGKVNSTVASKIQELTGVNVDGFDVAIEARQIEHILKDHGPEGRTDHSMANENDIAKIEYVLNSPDKITKSGKTKAYWHTVNGRNRTADTVLYEKSIGTDSYYAVQAVADTKAKTLHIVSAFIGKPGYENKKAVQSTANVNSPVATSEIDFATNVQLTDATDTNIIPQTAPIVKGVDDAELTNGMSDAAVSALKEGVAIVGEVEAGEWALDFREAYESGKRGLPMPDGAESRSIMTDGQREAAYKMGAAERTAKSQTVEDSSVDTAAKEEATFDADNFEAALSQNDDALTTSAKAAGLTDAEITAMKIVERATGRRIALGALDGAAGKTVGHDITVDPNSEEAFAKVVAHELLHTIEGTKYNKRVMSAMRKYTESKGLNWDDLIAKAWEDEHGVYEKNGEVLDDTGAEYEAGAKIFATLFNSPAELQAFAESIERGVVERMRNRLAQIVKRIREDVSYLINRKNSDAATVREAQLIQRRAEDALAALERALRKTKGKKSGSTIARWSSAGEGKKNSDSKNIDKANSKGYNEIKDGEQIPFYETYEKLSDIKYREIPDEEWSAGRNKAQIEYGVTLDEDIGIDRYVDGFAYDIVRLQRQGESAQWNEYERYIAESIEKGLLKHPTYTGRTYRNLTFDTKEQLEAFLDEHISKNEVTLPALTSASKNPNGYPVTGNYIAHLVIDAVSSRDISETYGLLQEEVIFLPGTKYAVTKITTANDGHTLIFAKEINKGEVQNVRGRTEGGGLSERNEAVFGGQGNDTHGVEMYGGREEIPGRVDQTQNDSTVPVYRSETSGGNKRGRITPNDESVSSSDRNSNTRYSASSGYSTKAKTPFERKNRELAIAMLKEGKSGDEVYKATGWLYDDFGELVLDRNAPVYTSDQRSVSERIAEENEALRRQLYGLEGKVERVRANAEREVLRKISKDYKLSPEYTPVTKKARSVVKEISDNIGGCHTAAQIREYAERIIALYDEYSAVDASGTHAVDISELAPKIYELIAEMQDVQIENKYSAKEAKLIREVIKGNLYLSEKARGEFVGSYTELRKNTRKYFTLVPKGKGTSVDARYEELSEAYPEWFPPNIVDEAERLEKIIEVAETVHDPLYVSEERYDSHEGEKARGEDESYAFARILDAFSELDEMPRTLADKYARRAEAAEREAEAARAELQAEQREHHNTKQAFSEMQAQYREGILRDRERVAREVEVARLKRTFNRIKKIFEKPTKERNVKAELIDFVGESLEAIEALFNEKIDNETLVRSGIDFATEREQELIERYRELLDMKAELETYADADGGINSSETVIEKNIREVASMESVFEVDKSRLEKSGKRPSEIFSENFARWGNVLYSDELGEITLPNSSIKSEIRHGLTAEKIASIEAIPEVIKKGKIIFSETKADSDVKRIVVCAPINIGDKLYYMGVMLQRDAQTQRLYLHNVAIVKEASELAQADLLTTGALANGENLFITSILQNALVVKYKGDKNIIEKVNAELKQLDARLSGVFARARSQQKGQTVAPLLRRLVSDYGAIQNSDSAHIAAAYDEVAYEYMKSLANDEVWASKTRRNMTSEDIAKIGKLTTMVANVIYRSNNLFLEGKNKTVSQSAATVGEELSKVDVSIFGKHVTNWKNLKPVYLFRRIGSQTLQNLYEQLRRGEDAWATDMGEAEHFFTATAKKYGYKKWNRDAAATFRTNSGQKLDLTLDQRMSLYAYSKRKQADEHLADGGIVFEDDAKSLFGKIADDYKAKREAKKQSEAEALLRKITGDATAYRISPELMAQITSSLTKEQRAFVDEMQSYLSVEMARKGNEISMKLYGIELFGEENYFPIESAPQYMVARYESQQREVKAKNMGMTKATVAHAKNPMVLRGFMDVWAGHVNKMSLYHGIVLPTEDITKVYGYIDKNSEGSTQGSVRADIENLFGKGATSAINALIRDVNGGIRYDDATIADKLISRTKAASVMGSLSVAVQQPTAVIRAMAYINPKYFAGLPKPTPKSHASTMSELTKYAPVAYIKKMGRFDTSTGKGAVEYLKGDKNALDYVNDFMGWGASWADEIAWCNLWKACKREAAAKDPSLKNDSNALCRAAAKRFNEVVTLTQVYDSVFSRSERMRSKSVFAQMTTAFMAEPTTVKDMLVDAIVQVKRGSGKAVAGVIPAVACSTVVNGALAALVYAMRDDEEDENYLEKWLASFTSGIIDSANPMTYIPLLRDVWSIFQGYDVERMDMSLIGDFVNAADKTVKKFMEADGAIDGIDAAGTIIGAFLNIFPGIPVKNIMRDAYGIYRTIAKSRGNPIPTTKLGTYQAFEEALKQPFARIPMVKEFVGVDKKADVLYEAATTDTAHFERMRGTYASEESFERALRAALRENDERVRKAAVASADGDVDGVMDIINEIAGEGHFDAEFVESAVRSAHTSYNNYVKAGADAYSIDDDEAYEEAVEKLVVAGYDEATVEAAIKAEASAIALGESTLRSVGSNVDGTLYTSADIGAALEGGKYDTASKIVDELIEAKVSSGAARKKAESSVKSTITSYIKPLYKAAYAAKDKEKMLALRKWMLATKLYGRTSVLLETLKDWIREK